MPPRLMPWYAAILTRTPLREVQDEWTADEWDTFWAVVRHTPEKRRPFDWASNVSL